MFSKILFRSSSDPRPEDWASDGLVDLVEWVHDALDPVLVDLIIPRLATEMHCVG